MKMLALLIAAAILLLVVLGGCARSSSAEQTEAAIELMLEKTVAKNKVVRNAILLVDAPSLGIGAAWTAGTAYEQDGTAMSVDTPFLSASVGKLFTSALVLSLAEEEILSLEDSIVTWLEPSLIAGLPVAGGDRSLEQITIRRLLAHRSGLPDYFSGRSADDAPNLLDLLVQAPELAWTPQRLLEYTKKHFAPAGVPGEIFLYADTNYDLLGLVVEAATGQDFQDVMAERIFKPLGLRNTWMHAFSDDPYADAWVGDFNAAGIPALTLEVAGGGLATTVDDLRTFLRSLLEERPVSLGSLQTEWSENAIARGIDYGYGLWRIRPAGLFFLLRGYPEMLGVSGSTGSFLYWVPAYDAVIAGTFNQTGFAQKHVAFLIRVLGQLKRVAAE